MRYPKSWNEVNLAQLHELDLLRQRTDLDAEEIMNQILSVLSNQHIEEIEKQPHTHQKSQNANGSSWAASGIALLQIPLR
jgi:cytochrome c553